MAKVCLPLTQYSSNKTKTLVETAIYRVSCQNGDLSRLLSKRRFIASLVKTAIYRVSCQNGDLSRLLSKRRFIASQKPKIFASSP
ncbi:hypothetical protein [Nostoc sphaeroides]|uniref:Anaerobic glycerol-3-phosphate dehydrogenase subunit B n=1 Tax=Nostoc sphaeroides CCNUC1 TaxID=2653204 RepID=A0A5P8VWD0_9NOSO|nr:hypothetical protein [Nostoc sphaeroides]QFS44189.1 Anaerobic glycerol-3-phosphate dehydrogenase subunit B [Nostoc sphaeroides CCNUC1]